MGMRRGWRALFLVAAWIYVFALVLQVFLAGMMIFGGASHGTHLLLGWTLHLVPVVLFVLAWASRSGPQTLWIALALAIVQFIQPVLPGFASSAPAIAAFHPVLAMAIFLLAVWVAWRAWRLWQSHDPRESGDAASG